MFVFGCSGTPVPCLIRPERCINKRLARHNAVSELRQSSRSDEPCAVGEYYSERHVRHTPKHATNNGALRVHSQRLHNPQHPAAMPVPMQPALSALLAQSLPDDLRLLDEPGVYDGTGAGPGRRLMLGLIDHPLCAPRHYFN